MSQDEMNWLDSPNGPDSPDSPDTLATLVATAQSRLRIEGAGTKAAIGRAKAQGTNRLCTLGLDCITYYQPSEFVLSAQAGCRLSAINARLADDGLTLPFCHPWEQAGATIGGAIATNIGGAERLDLGAPRDNVLGVQYVNGQGALLRAGGRVMKNVTGLDFGRALSGSWGRLAVLTEITLKVVPLTRMLGAQFSPLSMPGKFLWRISIPARNASSLLAALHRADTESETKVDTVTRTDTETRAEAEAVTKAETKTADSIGANGAITRVHQDWNGALTWASTDDPRLDVHAIAAQFAGHALRVRGGPDGGQGHDGRAFHPQSGGLVTLENKVKAAFDPGGIFDSPYDALTACDAGETRRANLL